MSDFKDDLDDLFAPKKKKVTEEPEKVIEKKPKSAGLTSQQ